jgi:hypothetical protein
MILSSGHKGHSADVRMHLLINGTSLPVAQLGPDFLLLDGAVDHPPTDASILLGVDESERQWRVHLPEGISASSKRVVISVIS